MKSLLSVLALSAALGLAAGCAPQEAFCPNTSALDAGGVCPVNGDLDAFMKPMDMSGGSLCASNEFSGENPDGDGHSVCLCRSNSLPPPCP